MSYDFRYVTRKEAVEVKKVLISLIMMFRMRLEITFHSAIISLAVQLGI